MELLIKNVRLLHEYGFGDRRVCIGIKNEQGRGRIAYVGEAEPSKEAKEVIDGNGNLVIPAFYNAHCHAAMTLFRGYGEDLPLQRWLNEKIWPAEERLTKRNVYVGAKLACAEMIRNGIVSFTDMYMFEDSVADAVLEVGMKANLSRCIVSFDNSSDMKNDSRVREAIELADKYNGAGNGRIKIDMSLHAEYTNVPNMCEYVARYSAEHGFGIQVHVSETEREHNECIERHGKTPIEFFESVGVLDVPTSCAHCVWVSDNDIEIMKKHSATAVHNPVSNLKLGSGVMPLHKFLEAGVNVALGTDGTASNNSLDIMKELNYATLLAKGIQRKPDITVASKMIDLATVNGAVSQGRYDCGKIKVGMAADLVMIDMNAPNNMPCYDVAAAVTYSANSSNVLMTVCDGRILYRDGEYTSIDIKGLCSEFGEVTRHYFD